MADKYQFLNTIPYLFSDPRSPIYQKVTKALAPLEQQAAQLDPESPEYEKLQQEYNTKAAQLMYSELQKAAGAPFPTRKEAEDYDYAQRSGGDTEKEAVLRQGSVATPYNQAFNVLERLQKYLPQTTPTAAAVPQAGSQPTPPAPKPMRMPIKLKQGASDDEKLSETQQMLLYNLAGMTHGPQTAESFEELDTPPLQGGLPTPDLLMALRDSLRK